MNIMKRVISLLLCVAMLAAYLPAAGSAAAAESNVTATVDKTRVNVGETVEVTLSYKDMKVSSIGAGIRFDTTMLECVEIVGHNPNDAEAVSLKYGRGYVNGSCSTLEQANNEGTVGFVVGGTQDVSYKEADIYTATFKALKKGTVNITAYEDSDGESGYNGDANTVVVTVKGPSAYLPVSETAVKVGDEFEVTLSYYDMTVSTFNCGIRFDTNLLECVSIMPCDPEYPNEFVLCGTNGTFALGSCSTVAEANGNGRVGFGYPGTKDAAYKACDIFTVTFKAKETGTTTITAFEKSDGAEAIFADVDTQKITIKPLCEHSDSVNDGDHKCDVCGEPNVSDCTEDTKDVTITKPTCTEEGKGATVTFCPDCEKEFGRVEFPIAKAGHTWDVDYTWADDYSSCTAARTCAACGTEEKAEAVITSETTGTNCTDRKTTYTATFDVDWAETQTAEKKLPTEHGELEITINKSNAWHEEAYSYCGEIWTLKVYCKECREVILEVTPESDVDISREPTCTKAGQHTHTTSFADVELPEGASWDNTSGNGYDGLGNYNTTRWDNWNDDLKAVVKYVDGHPGILQHIWSAEPAYYRDNGDGTHTAIHTCSRDASHTEERATENHSYVNGECVCKAVQTFTVTVAGDYASAITLSEPTAVYGEEYVTKIETSIGSDVIVERVWKNGTYNSQMWEYDEATNTLTVKASYVNADLVVEANPVVYATTNLAGGQLRTKYSGRFTVVDGTVREYREYNTTDFLFCEYDYEFTGSFEMVPDANIYFEKAGYKVIGYKDAEGNFYEMDYEFPWIQNINLTLVWECQHEDKTYDDNGDGTHTITCANGCDLGTEDHDYSTSENECTCVCGNERIITIYFYVGNELVETVSGVYGTPVTVPVYEVPEGHTLYGWNNVPEILSADVDEEEYRAYLGVNTYGLILYINDKCWIQETFDFGEKIFDYNADYVANYLKEGYTFSGWDLPDTMPAEDLNLYATLTVNTYPIVLLDVNGNVIETGEGKFGDMAWLYLPDGVASIEVNDENRIGTWMFNGLWLIVNSDGTETELTGATTIPVDGLTVRAQYVFTGWVNDNGWHYEIENEIQKTGWTEINGAWYYLDPVTGNRSEGVARAPYPTEAINGITYAPDQESIDYANKKGQTFIDETEGWFIFDEDGKFQSSETGMGTYFGATRYAENGHIAWHPGMIAVGEDYYYFIGDVTNGGNIMATGDIYISRDNTDFGAVKSGVYTFAEDGKLCEYNGITEVNGKLRYYENAQLMKGAGLVKLTVDGETKYIYVRSNGELVVDAEYWVAQLNGHTEINEGMAKFDKNGYMIIEVAQVAKTGVYFEEGKWVYYVEGAKQYNAGLVLLPAETKWFNAAGEVVKELNAEAYVYVRSNAQLVTGTYWITNTHEVMATGKYDFDEFGLMQSQMNGIYLVEGNLVFYKDNQIAYNAGLIRFTGTSSEGVVYDNAWIYVRSNGQLAVGTYWITNTNGEMTAGKYTFDENGKMQVEEGKKGIVQENGKLFYYVDGVKQVGTGLTVYGDSYIYVKSNGELAVGDYYVTNSQGLLSQGMYTFGEDGIMIR